MTDIIALIKIIAILQFVIVIALLLSAYGIKIFLYLKAKRQKRIQLQITNLLTECIDGTDNFSPKSIIRYKKDLEILLPIINAFDETINSDKWQKIRKVIIELIVRPQVTSLAKSTAWDKRYRAYQCFKLTLENQDENTIKALINDPIPLVAINAATLAISRNSQALIDAVIDTFSQGRRLQQSLYAQVMAGAGAAIVPLIKNRLKRETNPYIKAFCYRSLIYVPVHSDLVETTSSDLNSRTLDLKLAVIDYLYHNNPQTSCTLLLDFLRDNQWEIRARSAKLLGDSGNHGMTSSLEKCLGDSEWWVRFNSAEALAKLGPKGIAILKKQTPTLDQYAYDVATQVLSTKTGVHQVCNPGLES